MVYERSAAQLVQVSLRGSQSGVEEAFPRAAAVLTYDAS
jgi:hypothetical protein